MTAPLPLDTPAELVTLIDYQEGAVVSRTLLKTASGTVSLFAFDAGEGLSEHTAPFDVLLQILAGRAEITIGGTAHGVGAGEIIRLPMNIPHSVSACERFKMLLTMIRPA